MRSVVLLLAASCALAGCGARKELEPVAGNVLPPAPYGRDEARNAAELLEPDPQAAPVRSVELRSRSEERADDPFDLPPEG